ncbi:MAG: MFS transporter [Candidatus Heimdallarchaeota archaeon]|nr:MFS transporter [Candidatus Heimdallarchaeota archaeon]
MSRLSYVILWGSSIFNLSIGILEPLAGPYLEELGASSRQLGYILSIRWLMVALVSIPFAMVASRIGYTKILMLSAVYGLVGVYFLLQFRGIFGLYLFYYSIGVAAAAASGPGAAIMAENLGSKRVAAFSLLSITWMVPTALGAGISWIWFSNRGDTSFSEDNVRSIFSIIAIVTIIGIGIYALLLLRDFRYEKVDSEAVETKYLTQFKTVFAPIVVIPVVLLMIVNLLSGAGAGAMLPFLSPYLKTLGAGPEDVSLLTLILNLSMGLATFLVVPLSNRFGQYKVYAATQILAIVCLIGLALSTNLIFASIFFIFRGMFANMTVPIAQSVTLTYIDTKVRATGSALTTNIRWAGWVIFSPISGTIIDRLGYLTSFVFTSVLYSISAALFLFVALKIPSLEAMKISATS